MKFPTFKDIIAAQQRISKFLDYTPLHSYPLLNKFLETEVYVKHENFQPTGAFKIRGGLNLISQLSIEEKKRGVITASTGNHGQSIALASKIFGVKAKICVPENSNPVKLAAMHHYDAEIIEFGKDFDEARVNAEKLAEKHGYRYIHSGNEPLLIAGVGTIGLEILQQQPDIEVIISPVGAGTGCGGTAIAAKSIDPELEMIAVQAEKAPSVYQSWRSGKLESTDSAETMADGLATRQAFSLPTDILREWVNEFYLVTEEEIKQAIKTYLKLCHTVAEGAGAAPLAAAINMKEKLKGKKVALVLSGGNLDYNILENIINNL